MSLPNNPITRKETYLAKIAGQSPTLPDEPITREEMYLDYIAKNGGGSGSGDMTKAVYDSDLDVATAGGIKSYVSGAITGKQDKLTFDDTPTASSNNPVKSGGIYTALSTKISTEACEQLVDDTVGWSGKNRLENTSTSGQKQGLTFTKNADGSITVTDSANQNTVWNVGSVVCKANTKYILSGCPSGGSDNNYRLQTQSIGGTQYFDYGDGVELLFNTDTTVTVTIRIVKDVPTDLLYKPMIRLAELDSTYEPYHASVDECKADNSVIAPEQNGTSPTETIYAGSYFIHDGVLCKAKVNILTTDTFVEGTNYEVKDIASELNEQVGTITSSIEGANLPTLKNRIVKQGNRVTLNLYMEGVDLEANTVKTLANITPNNFRPITSAVYYGAGITDSGTPLRCYVGASGNIGVTAPTNETNANICFSISYYRN